MGDQLHQSRGVMGSPSALVISSIAQATSVRGTRPIRGSSSSYRRIAEPLHPTSRANFSGESPYFSRMRRRRSLADLLVTMDRKSDKCPI